MDQVTVSYPVPTATLTAEPATVNYPGTTTLTWATTNATAVTISPDIGTVDPSGTLEVSPLANTTYTLTATGPGGAASKSATVTVIYPQPTATFSAEPSTVKQGEPAQLTWSAEYADSCAITPLIGPVPCTGSQGVTPDNTTTYTFAATGPGGSTSKTATVTVAVPPVIDFQVDKDQVPAGETVLLEWSVLHADTVVIEPGLGAVAAVGTTEIRIEQTAPIPSPPPARAVQPAPPLPSRSCRRRTLILSLILISYNREQVPCSPGMFMMRTRYPLTRASAMSLR